MRVKHVEAPGFALGDSAKTSTSLLVLYAQKMGIAYLVIVRGPTPTQSFGAHRVDKLQQ